MLITRKDNYIHIITNTIAIQDYMHHTYTYIIYVCIYMYIYEYIYIYIRITTILKDFTVCDIKASTSIEIHMFLVVDLKLNHHSLEY